MHFDRNVLFVQCLVEIEAVLHRHGFVIRRVDQENGWSFGGHIEFGRVAGPKFRRVLFAQKIAAGTAVRGVRDERYDRIHQDGEVGSRTETVDRVGGIRVTGVELGGGGGGEMATGGETHDTNLAGVDVPLGGAVAHGPKRAVRVHERGQMRDLVAGVLRQTVFEHDAGNTDGVEPLRGLNSLPVVGEHSIATAWANDHRLAGGFPFGGQVNLDGGILDLGDADDVLARIDDFFQIGIAVVGWGAVPEAVSRRCWGDSEGEEEGDENAG